MKRKKSSSTTAPSTSEYITQRNSRKNNKVSENYCEITTIKKERMKIKLTIVSSYFPKKLAFQVKPVHEL